MKTLKRLVVVIFLLMGTRSVLAQDPSFSQFFSSPLNINPGLTANINADWRVISNFRDQWIGPASPYVTGTISYDMKIMQNKVPNVETENNIIGIGTMLMFDHAMSGVVKSTYASLNLSYNIKLMENDQRKQRLGLGFGGIYGRRHVAFDRLTFEEQFAGNGFNTNLPTGEAALENMRPYFSASAGIVYSYTSQKSNLDLGVAGFHVNKPKQTFLKDENQVLAMRKVAHANFETFLNERVVLNTNGIYQFQDKASYFSVGGGLGYSLGDAAESLITAGLWYWSKNAIIPYAGLAYGDFQFGLSYDITISKLSEAEQKPKTFEISFIIRGDDKPDGVMWCPWK